MKKITELLARGLLTCMLVALFLAVTPVAYAEYEISTTSEFSINVPTDGTVVQFTEDLVISWEKPTVTAPDELLGYIYKWSDDPTALSDVDFNSENEDGEIDKAVTTYQEVAAFFADDDSNDIRYLHLKTLFYDNSAGAAAYSSDVVIGGTTGGINIDNVAPTGSIRITDDAGNDITTTYSSSLNLRLSASLAPAKMYLSETDTRPATGEAYLAEPPYDLGDSTPGSKTIYAWFEDGVGNISTAPATDTVTLLPSVSISPYDPTLDLATTSTQVFAVDGNNDPYDWEIIVEIPDTGGDDVAQFSGASTGTNSVTVEILNPGTFKLQAAPAVGDALTSGTITVMMSVLYGDVSGNGTINAYDASLAAQYGVGLITLDADKIIAADVSGNGTVNAYDASLIAQKGVGLIDTFPVEQ
jgi:hypothetical protein